MIGQLCRSTTRNGSVMLIAQRESLHGAYFDSVRCYIRWSPHRGLGLIELLREDTVHVLTVARLS